MTPDAAFAALRATWPPVEIARLPDWEVPRGAGGGQRVSAAVALTDNPDIEAMEAAQLAFGQQPAVQVRTGQDALDERLEALGYASADPTVLLAASAGEVAEAPPPVTVFDVTGPPTVTQAEIWAEGGIGPARLAIMDRATGPKCTLLGRRNDTPLATAFVAKCETIAMLHALEVLPGGRRQGLARHMMGYAGVWAQDQGAEWLAVAVTQGNAPALKLYASLGMKPVGQYVYRKKPSG